MNEIKRTQTGSFIAQLRREKGLTQKELAERLFISDKAVSKWETGVSMPDTALLIPLSEILGVSVTELLKGARIEDKLEPEEAEALVKDVLDRSRSTEKDKWARKTRVLRIFFISCLIIGGALSLVCYLRGILSETVAICFVLPGIFGIYFCFFAKARLPEYYDKNTISTYSHGPVRMNIPGLRFTNGNFPHIVRFISLWSAVMLLLCPTFTLIADGKAGGWAGRAAMLVMLAGLVVPLYIIGKKYE